MGRTRPTTKSGDCPSIHSQPAPRTRPRRAHGDDGAALVEFALVAPILFLILFGIVEFGINLNDYQAIRQSVRDAARSAVVGNYGSGSCAPATPATAGGNSTAVMCTAKQNTGVNTLAVKVVFIDNNGAADFSADKVRVCAVSKAKSTTGLIKPFLSSVYLKSTVEMRAEKALTLSATAQSASDPSGANWSWCPDTA